MEQRAQQGPRQPRAHPGLRPSHPGLSAPRLGARGSGLAGAARGRHSPGQELKEDHVTAAACEHQAHREDRAHGQRKGRGASSQRKRPPRSLSQEAGPLPRPPHRTSPPSRGAALLRGHRGLRPRSCSSQSVPAPFIRGGVLVRVRLHLPGCRAPLRRAGTCPASAG